MKKEKIGFFGGCFNPPTNTHIDLANKLIKNGIIEKVIFVPVGNYYQKQNLASAEDRYCQWRYQRGIRDIRGCFF